jgi:hypothetical protein
MIGARNPERGRALLRFAGAVQFAGQIPIAPRQLKPAIPLVRSPGPVDLSLGFGGLGKKMLLSDLLVHGGLPKLFGERRQQRETV